MSDLEHLFTKYGTDKGIWGYTSAYVRHLNRKRFEVKRVLEIGICGFRDIPNNVVGASLFAWREYFPNAQIFGLDNDGRFIFNDQSRITTAQCDAYNAVQLYEAIDRFGGNFDFICDDAVHDPMPQLALLHNLWPYLNKGGTYAIEELCPYKLPNGDVTSFTRHIPPDSEVEIITTHKDERLCLITR
jgi:hypothetical protein